MCGGGGGGGGGNLTLFLSKTKGSIFHTRGRCIIGVTLYMTDLSDKQSNKKPKREC